MPNRESVAVFLLPSIGARLLQEPCRYLQSSRMSSAATLSSAAHEPGRETPADAQFRDSSAAAGAGPQSGREHEHRGAACPRRRRQIVFHLGDGAQAVVAVRLPATVVIVYADEDMALRRWPLSVRHRCMGGRGARGPHSSMASSRNQSWPRKSSMMIWARTGTEVRAGGARKTALRR